MEGWIQKPSANSTEERDRICFTRQLVERFDIFDSYENHGFRRFLAVLNGFSFGRAVLYSVYSCFPPKILVKTLVKKSGQKSAHKSGQQSGQNLVNIFSILVGTGIR